jgi:hypothetical protein
MARRKKHTIKKRHTSRKRSHKMGAITGGTSGIVAIVAGAVIARFVSNAITSNQVGGNAAPYVAAAAPIGVGLFMPKIIKSDIGKNLGHGMIASGGVNLLQATGALKGIMNMSRRRMPAVAGYRRGMGLAPSTQNPRGVIAGVNSATMQNPRGVIAGMSTREAAILAS